jgi:hypothetical protein
MVGDGGDRPNRPEGGSAVSPTVVMDRPRVTVQALRPLRGSLVTVRTERAAVRGLLLSCVSGSAWLVVDDADVLVGLDDIVSVDAA